jgi:hypothetical protein
MDQAGEEIPTAIWPRHSVPEPPTVIAKLPNPRAAL